MKSKIIFPLLAVSVLLISTSLAPAQPAESLGFAPGSPAPSGLPLGAIDPATGLPVGHGAGIPGAATALSLLAPPVEPWKDADWKEPALTLKEVAYDSLPLSEVARHMEEQFTNAFDVILPQNWEGNAGEEQRDWLSTPVSLRLKNVTASEIFNAMNLTFDNNRTPLRWVLKMNGRRPVALLRVMQPRQTYAGDRRTVRRVIYVGDLIGDKADGLTMQQIIKTVTDVYQMSFNRPIEGVQFHKDAQLLIVTGTNEQLDLVTQTLAGMKQKVGQERGRLHYAPNTPPETRPAPEYIKPPGPK